MSTGNTDEFGVKKIFSDSETNPKFYKFQSGDKRKFNRHYGSCPENGDKTHSVITTEWNKSGEEFVDQEVTGYFYFPEIDSDEGKHKCYKYERGGMGSALAVKLRGGKHDKGNDSAKCYIFDFQYEGKHQKEKNFQKEYPHGDYYKMNVVPKFDLKNNLQKWVGYKVITMTVTINQKEFVRCMALVDYGSEDVEQDDGPNLDNQQWKVYYDVTDDGELDEKFDISNKKDYKGEVKKPWKQHFGNQLTQFRMDRIVNPEARFLSVRRIAASADSIDTILKAF
jgi:hypothetical protein